MRLQVIVRAPGEEEFPDIFDIQEPECVIGRVMSDIQLSDLKCSRRHAVFFEGRPGVLHVMDLTSKNGTYVNGTKVFYSPVMVGDEVRVGRTVVKVLDFRSDQR